MHWHRGTNGWVTGENFPGILTIVRRAILRHRPGAQVVVVCDAAPQHICAAAVLQAQRLRVHLVCIPGRITWLVQPLDTHAFAALKRLLHRLQQQARAAAPGGVLAATQWIELLETAVHELLVRGEWRDAIGGNGLLGDTRLLRPRLGELLTGHLPLPLRPPADEDMEAIVGRRRVGLAEALCRGAVRYQRGHAVPLAVAAGGLAGAPPVPALAAPAGAVFVG
jgi:hypothetical protein